MSAPGRRPYETERAAMTAMHAAIPPEHDRVTLTPGQRRDYLAGVFEAAGVEISAFESRTARWLCQWEDYTASVIGRWVKDAYEAGKPGPRTVTIDLADADAHHVLTEALERYADHERVEAAIDGGNEARERWASIADRWRAEAKAARNQQETTEGGTSK